MKSGKFVISLDFELHWGGAEKYDLIQMSDYFMTTRKLIPEMLSIFESYNIRATWATVGFLFAKDKEQLISFIPDNKPTYTNELLSSYNYMEIVGNNEKEDPFHFATSLIEQVINTNGQELASHTFSHYYCNEPGQQLEQFEADLKAAKAISKENFGIELTSLVFPRNQFNKSYLEITKKQGFKVVRSNPDTWIWNNESKLTPLFRAVDTLMSVSSPTSFSEKDIDSDTVIQLPSSRFFRPYKDNERLIQGLKMNRIKSEMTYAAKNGLVYHLWWHPHNFAENRVENIKQLKEIINHFNMLNANYGFESVNMGDFGVRFISSDI